MMDWSKNRLKSSHYRPCTLPVTLMFRTFDTVAMRYLDSPAMEGQARRAFTLAQLHTLRRTAFSFERDSNRAALKTCRSKKGNWQSLMLHGTH